MRRFLVVLPLAGMLVFACGDSPSDGGATAGAAGASGSPAGGRAGSGVGGSQAGEGGSGAAGEAGDPGSGAGRGGRGGAGSGGDSTGGTTTVGGNAGSGGGGNGGTGGSGGITGGTSGGGTGGAVVEGGAAGEGGQGGDGGNVVTCIGVSPTGDDQAATGSDGALPFRNVQSAIDFVSASPNAPRTVCVAAGPTCGLSADFAGPGGGFTMRDGVSVVGKYESTSWTRCQYSVTRLLPATASGIAFGAGVQSATLLDGFRITLAAVPATVGVTIAGARGVVLSDLDLLNPEAPLDITGIDVSGGADVTLSDVSLNREDVPLASYATGVAIGLRCVGSSLTVEDSEFDQVNEGTSYGLWLDGATSVTISRSTFAARTSGTSIAAFGGLIVGGDAALLVDSGFSAGPSQESQGLALEQGAAASLENTRVFAQGSGGDALGLRAQGAVAQMTGTSEARVTSQGPGYGVWLEDAAGSSVGNVVATVAGAGAGVGIVGNGAGIVIGNVSATLGAADAAAISMENCGGAEPLVRGSILVQATSNVDHIAAVRALGDCHPRVEASQITTKASVSGLSGVPRTGRGVRCDALLGTPSACTVVGNVIKVEVGNFQAGSHAAIGVSCSGGSCGAISNNQFQFERTPSCFAGCNVRAHGVATDVPRSAPDGNTVAAVDCGTVMGYACWDEIALYPNYLACPSGLQNDGDLLLFKPCVP